MKKVAAVVAALVLGIGAVAGAADLQTTSGTMQLGGAVTFDINMYMPKSGSNATSYQLGFAPEFGYFIMDNLEILGVLNATMAFGDATDKTKHIGFGAGARYILKMGAMSPYFGLLVGMNFAIPDEGSTVKAFDIIAPIGLMYALNEHVALDFGLKVTFSLGLDDQGNWLMVPIGYLGVQAFF